MSRTIAAEVNMLIVVVVVVVVGAVDSDDRGNMLPNTPTANKIANGLSFCAPASFIP